MKKRSYARARKNYAAILIFLAFMVGLIIFLVIDHGVLGIRPPLEVPFIPLGQDMNENGVDDALDIVEGARLQVEARPAYRSQYHAGGYPPDDEGVCTDLVWRALKHAGYDLKEAIDKDIAQNPNQYPRASTPDPNIDFRRVPNLHVFLKRNHITLTTELRPWDLDNLTEWQPGDIVILGRDDDHIGIVSDKRRRDGVPLIIHHAAGYPTEDDALAHWPISGHFRLKR